MGYYLDELLAGYEEGLTRAAQGAHPAGPSEHEGLTSASPPRRRGRVLGAAAVGLSHGAGAGLTGRRVTCHCVRVVYLSFGSDPAPYAVGALWPVDGAVARILSVDVRRGRAEAEILDSPTPEDRVAADANFRTVSAESERGFFRYG